MISKIANTSEKCQDHVSALEKRKVEFMNRRS